MSAPLMGSDAAPMPRENGELIFAEPWERRVFGLTAALCEGGHLDWATFQGALIRAIDSEEALPHPGRRAGYYTIWLGALETLLVELQLLDTDLIQQALAEVVSRPHGHDHQAQDGEPGPTTRR